MSGEDVFNTATEFTGRLFAIRADAGSNGVGSSSTLIRAPDGVVVETSG
ncbi:hypothetical protein OV142_32810 [Nannocystis sp. SCPEA4]|nr:hypothetical protein [Nannocystis sp. SCPEA4]